MLHTVFQLLFNQHICHGHHELGQALYTSLENFWDYWSKIFCRLDAHFDAKPMVFSTEDIYVTQ